jgi:class 3 adenylate cyclase
MNNDDGMGDDVSLDSSSGSKGSGNQVTTVKETERQTLGRKETKAVGYLKIGVAIVLLTATLLVSIFTFKFTRDAEIQDFETQFDAHATRVIESFREVFDRQLAAVDVLSSSMTSYALASGSTFPNVTVPDFEVLGANTRILSDALIVFYCPLVSNEDRTGFEAYARDMEHQFDEALVSENELRERQDEAFGLSGRRAQELPPIQPEIYKFGVNGTNVPVTDGSGPYLPIWQITPIFSLFKDSLMFDLNEQDSVVDHLKEAVRTEQAVLNNIHDNFDPEDFDDTANTLFKLFLQLGQYRGEADAYNGDPNSNMAYPVFSDFSEDRKIVGMLMTTLYWKVYFKDVLPPGADGIYVVLESDDKKAVNQTITYRIDGTEVTYLGGGDRHDTSFDHLEQSQDITNFIRERASVRTRSYTAVELNDEYIHYTLRVYPSTELEDAYVTNKPIAYTVVVVCVFLFSSLVFLAYDFLVERRQTIVMDKAVKSSAVVASLFPENVRDRLYNEQDAKAEKEKDMTGWRATDNNEKALMTIGSQVTKTGRPIADKFDNTTVLFADLAGFTKWSSTRMPEEVFELLETFFGAFDRIAKRRSVFKVETIGDCYMAATGLPKPQPDHAIRMAKFARDCMLKMKQLTKDLEESLGKDVSNLSFRIGMHSGSVTAGVLRGDKGRFQLFGDTVNTAARMESNGVVGRIQCSQETADELIAAGRPQWVTKREGGIEAKGKGMLQTYFVDMTSTKSIATSSAGSDDESDDAAEENLDNATEENLGDQLKNM